MVAIRDLEASSLTHVDISCADWCGESVGLYSANRLGVAPVMSTLRLVHSIRVPLLPGLGTITTLILHHLDMEHAPFHCFFDLLKSVPSLVNLELDGEILVREFTDTFPMVPIPSLSSLRILLTVPAWRRAYLPRFPSSFVARLCESLITPSLKNLAMSDLTERILTLFAESLPLYPTRYLNLKTFEISGLPQNELSIVHLIKALPSIRHLILSGSQVSEIISALQSNLIWARNVPFDHSAVINAASIWPHLHTITVSSECDPGILLQFVEARAAHGISVTKVRLFGGDDPYLVSRKLDWRKLRERIDLELISGLDMSRNEDL
jgi:hypothetical protein